MALNEKQRRFAREYIIDLNATQAAIRAGYSVKTAYSIGQRLLKNVEIQNEIQHIQKNREKRTDVTADKVVLEMAKVAFINIKDCFTKDNTLKDIQALPDDAAAAITSVETLEEFDYVQGVKKCVGYTKKIKLADKLRALELLGKHLGMFTDKVEVQGNLNNPFAGLSTEDLKRLIGHG